MKQPDFYVVRRKTPHEFFGMSNTYPTFINSGKAHHYIANQCHGNTTDYEVVPCYLHCDELHKQLNELASEVVATLDGGGQSTIKKLLNKCKEILSV